MAVLEAVDNRLDRRAAFRLVFGSWRQTGLGSRVLPSRGCGRPRATLAEIRVEGGRSALAAIERGGDGNLNALLIRLVGLTFMFGTAVAGHILLADWAYDSNTLREGLAARGAWVNILAMPNCLEVPAFSHHPYKQRNAVERFFNKLTLFRAVATCYDKWDDDSLASVKHASLRIWHRFNEPVT